MRLSGQLIIVSEEMSLEPFQISDQFYLDGRPLQILSGAIHYFRIHPDDWYHSLYNLKALGFNTVETYVPWNLHEAREESYDFSGQLDVEAFLTLAQQLGLYAIVRPSPYICAEWEFGGLPAWLLTKNCHIRSSDPAYLAYVRRYYEELLPRLARHEWQQGGNILMFQLENEYGSYGEDKAYLKAIKALMEEHLSAPLFTADGPWRATLRAGSLIEDDVFVTGNFGSRAQENFADMQAFFSEHGKAWPLMCMEFWDGWFNRWHEPIIKRDPEELADAVMEVLAQGSINLYMFHGGTNFGFMNGCSARKQLDLPQVTSYDYDAILDEAGNPTAKFYAIQKRLTAELSEIEVTPPLIKPLMSLPLIGLKDKVSLFSTLEQISTCQRDCYPRNMEALGQSTGYILYRTHLLKDKREDERLRLIDSRDRAQVFLDGQRVATQYQETIGDDIIINQKHALSQVDVLIENMGRVNYGHKLTAPSQCKGLGRGMMADLHFVTNWEMYCLPLDDLSQLCFDGDFYEGQPGFYHYQFECHEPQASYIDMTGFGKGCVFVNNHPIGRFWEVGPLLTLYIPKGYFNKGVNDIIIFETEGVYQDSIRLVDKPISLDCLQSDERNS